MDNQETIVIRRHLDMASKKFQLMFLLLQGTGVVYRSGLPIQGAMGIMERRGWKR